MSSKITNLSPKELEVWSLMASGLSGIKIANKLQIGEKTVKFHKSNIFKKLNVNSSSQATAAFYLSELERLNSIIHVLQSQVEAFKPQNASQFIPNEGIVFLPGKSLL